MRFGTLRIAILGTAAAAVTLAVGLAVVVYRAGALGPESTISLERAREIRKSAAREIDFAADGGVLLDHRRLRGEPASVGLELVRGDAGGFTSGGTALIARQLHRENGARSWEYNFGILEAFSYVTTLVEIDGEIYSQDSYLNFEFVRDDGTPMPLREVLRSLEQGIAPRMLTESDYEKDWHFSGTEPREDAPPGDRYRIEGDRVIYRAPLTFESLRQHGWSKAGLDWLEEHGYPRDPAFFMLYPLNVLGPGFKGSRCLYAACPEILVELSEKVDPRRRLGFARLWAYLTERS